MGTRAEPSGEEAVPPEEVFKDKEPVHEKTVCAQPPRWTLSDKTRGGAAGHMSTTRAASPELRQQSWRTASGGSGGRR
jgi:hypothetical protein